MLHVVLVLLLLIPLFPTPLDNIYICIKYYVYITSNVVLMMCVATCPEANGRSCTTPGTGKISLLVSLVYYYLSEF
jgi:hypothetical protein